jgi:hypothetical protein
MMCWCLVCLGFGVVCGVSFKFRSLVVSLFKPLSSSLLFFYERNKSMFGREVVLPNGVVSKSFSFLGNGKLVTCELG